MTTRSHIDSINAELRAYRARMIREGERQRRVEAERVAAARERLRRKLGLAAA